MNDWITRLARRLNVLSRGRKKIFCITKSMQNIQLKEVIRNNLCTDIDSHGPWFLGIAAFAVLMLPYLGFCYYNRAKMHAKLIREGLLSPYPPRFAAHFNGYRVKVSFL